MKLKNKAAIAAVLALVLLVCAFPASAEATPSTQKDEIIYANLSADGSVTGAYVVNAFELDEAGTVVDYGDYSSVANLTSDSEISYSSGTVSVAAEKGMFWYQGDLKEPELPWNIDITYLLDGSEVTADALAGGSGALEMVIAVTKNEACSSSAFDDYTLQISVSLDTALCSHISAPAGTVAAAGSNKQITFVSMAGTENEFYVTADVTDFEMASVTIGGVLMDMSVYLDSFDLSSITDSFTKQFSELSDAATQLDDGANQLFDGATQLRQGANEYSDGMDEYADGVGQFSDGTEQLASGIGQLQGGANQLYNGATQLSDGAKELSDGLDKLSDSGSSLTDGAYAIVQSTFDATNAKIAEMGYDIELTPENYTSMFSLFKTAMPDMAATIDEAQAQLDGVMTFYNGVKAYIDGVSQASDGAAQLSDGAAQLKSGIAAYEDGVAELSDGAQALNSSASQLSDGADKLSNGAAGIAEGALQLEQGLDQYADGTAQLKAGINGIDDKIADSVSEISASLVSPPGQAASFMSDKNTDVGSVQFIMQTKAITKSADAVPAETEQPLTFWQRLLRLFGLY